jgi:hypothetical protein
MENFLISIKDKGRDFSNVEIGTVQNSAAVAIASEVTEVHDQAQIV